MNERSRTPLVIAAVIVVVAVAALVAVVVTRGSSDEASSTTTSAGGSPGTTAGGEALVYGEVVVEGAALPQLDAQPDPAVGETPPSLVGTTYDGTPIEIVPGTDGPTMLVFLAHWCPHCNAEIPVLLDWRDSGAIPDDLQVVGVSTAVTDTRPNFPPSEWLADRGWDWPTLADDADGSAFLSYGGTGFPYFVVIGADGTVKARGGGELSVEQLDALVDTALA